MYGEVHAYHIHHCVRYGCYFSDKILVCAVLILATARQPTPTMTTNIIDTEGRSIMRISGDGHGVSDNGVSDDAATVGMIYKGFVCCSHYKLI